MSDPLRSALVRSALDRLASGWARDAEVFGLRQDSRWLWTPLGRARPAQPDVEVALGGSAGCTLALAGAHVDDPRPRLEAEASLLGHLLRSEADAALLANELVERQDQLLALHELARSGEDQLDLPTTLHFVATESARLLDAAHVVIALDQPRGPRLVAVQPATAIEEDALDAWVAPAGDPPQAMVGSDLPPSPIDGMPFWLRVPIRTRPAHVATLTAVRGDRPFRLPDLKLAQAIGEQAGSLVRQALSHREQLTMAARQVEMRLAGRAQEDLLPRRLPRLPGVDVHAVSRPAAEVGGDFYDLQALGTSGLFLCLGDVSGQGVPAALGMAMTHAVFRCALRTSPPEPQWLLRSAVSSLYDDFSALEMYATAFLAIYDGGTNMLRYVNAGHGPVFFRPAHGRCALLLPDEPPLGLLPSSTSSGHVRHLAAGDVLVAVSDGFTEARGPDGGCYGLERVALSIDACPPGADAVTITHAIFGGVDRFTGPAQQADDRTALVLRIRSTA